MVDGDSGFLNHLAVKSPCTENKWREINISAAPEWLARLKDVSATKADNRRNKWRTPDGKYSHKHQRHGRAAEPSYH